MMDNREVIVSRQNRNVVNLCKLTDRKERTDKRLFRFDGIKLWEEACRFGVPLCRLFFRESQWKKMETIKGNLEESYGISSDPEVFVLSDDVFDRISEEKSPDGVICVAKYLDKLQKIATIYNSADFLRLKSEKIVLMESVRDPQNMGAIIRSAAAIGVDRLIVSADCADIYHPKTVRASMGAIFNQPIDTVNDMVATVRELQKSGRRVFAAELNPNARLLGDFPLREGDTVVIGNEGHGISKELSDACSESVMIPMTNRAESFNAATAATLFMWEFCR